MKYFFQNIIKNNFLETTQNYTYFNPVNNKNELYGFSMEIIDILKYSSWTNGVPKVLENTDPNKVGFIDLENYTIQNLTAIFLCVLKNDKGLYLSISNLKPNVYLQLYELSSKPFIWYYRPNKIIGDNSIIKLGQLYIPYVNHYFFYNLTLSNIPNNKLDFYRLNNYCIYSSSKNYLIPYNDLDKIHSISHIYKNSLLFCSSKGKIKYLDKYELYYSLFDDIKFKENPELNYTIWGQNNNILDFYNIDIVEKDEVVICSLNIKKHFTIYSTCTCGNHKYKLRWLKTSYN